MRMQLCLLIILGLSITANAATPAPAATIIFRGSDKPTTYTLTGDKRTPSKLAYQTSARAVQTKDLASETARTVRNEIQSIVWKSLYQTPKASPCTPFADLTFEDKTTTVCRENAELTGRVSGLLYSLRARFPK